MDKLKEVIVCALGPALYRIYRVGSTPGRRYPINPLESLGDSAVKLVYLTWSIGVYTSPIIIPYLWHRGQFHSTMNGLGIRGLITTLIKVASAMVTVMTGGLLLRGYGRWTNAEYLSFLSSFRRLENLTAEEVRARKAELLRQFDFDFSRWPVEYRWVDSPTADPKKPPTPMARKSRHQAGQSLNRSSTLDKIKMLPCNIISYIAVHTFGRRMMYPGSVALVQKAMDSMLLEGRTRMIDRFGGERFKLQTYEGNQIDTLFVDRRNSSNQRGQKLVICCEGNAGFYAVGIMCTPLDAGYSVLGWNHPGFAGSTGLPFPGQVVSAGDTVMKFAHDRLGFQPEDIVVFAWSIGGYPSSWMAMQYPNISGLILDATFDDVVPLAVAKMPASWKPLVVNTVRNYFNLNISDNLSLYTGPVIIIRRLKDEIIHTVETDPIRTNRANDLLIKVLQQRFPNLLSDENPMWTLLDYLSGDPDHQRRVLTQNHVDDGVCQATLISYVQSKGQYSYPLDIGSPDEHMSEDVKTQLVLFLATKHFVDFDSTHCTPLPRQLFIQPWDLFKEAGLLSPSRGDSSLPPKGRL